jgi:hypothetical protein
VGGGLAVKDSLVKSMMGRFGPRLATAAKRFRPAPIFGRVWALRTPVCTTFVLVVGPIWLLSGLILQDPAVVLTGVGLLTLPALAVGYRVGAFLEARRKALEPPPPPPEAPREEEQEKKKAPPPAAKKAPAAKSKA